MRSPRSFFAPVALLPLIATACLSCSLAGCGAEVEEGELKPTEVNVTAEQQAFIDQQKARGSH